MKFCLIGCGNIAMSAHAPAYVMYRDSHPDFEMCACCDIDADRANKMRSRFGFARAYASYGEMLKREKPDCAAVIVSVNAAYQIGLDVIRAGIPIIMEKPPGRSSDEARALAREAKRAGVKTQVAFNRRYMPMLMHMRSELKRIAPPEGIQAITYDFYRFDRFDAQFSDTAIHGIDAARWLARSDYKRATFEYQELPEYGEGVCNIFMHAQMECSTRVLLRFCPVSGAIFERAAAHARGNTLTARTPISGSIDAPGVFEHYKGGERVSIIQGGAEAGFVTSGFYAENAAFFDAISARKAPEPSIQSTLNTMLVKECIDRRAPEFNSP